VARAFPARPLAAFAAIFDQARDVLLVRLSYDEGQWTLPAGNVDPGESPWEAVIREVREETGLDVDVERLYSVDWRRDLNAARFGFICRTGGALQPDGREILEVGYFPPDALPRPITTFTHLRVADAMQGGPVILRTFDRIEYLR
jgi:8-oxo-dGTP diphosphatase